VSKSKEIKKRNKGGRPTVYTPELGDMVCALYAGGMSEARIGRLKGMPSKRTLQNWRKLERGTFKQDWEVARQMKAAYHAEKGLQELEGLTDEDLKKLGRAATAAVSMRDKRANYHKWLASVLDRAGFGDAMKIDMDVRNQTLVAFVDMKPKTEEEVRNMEEPYILPHVAVPDGASGK